MPAVCDTLDDCRLLDEARCSIGRNSSEFRIEREFWNALPPLLTNRLRPCRLANVAGTQEPIYGASAIASVAEQCSTVPYTELKKEDVRWAALESTSVETQTFYVMAESGHLAMAQVIYSNVA